MFLSRVQSLRLAAELEDCSQQLDILGHTLTVQINGDRGTAAAQEKARLRKLTRDCQYVSQLMAKLHLELEEKQSFSSLLRVVEEIEQKKTDGNVKRATQSELKKRKQTILKQQEELQQKTQKLKGRSLEAQMKENLLKMRSKENTKENDTGLQLKKIQIETSQAETLLEQQLKLLQKQLMERTRVHEESEKFLRNQHEELQQLVRELKQWSGEMEQEQRNHLINVRFKRTKNLEKLDEMKSKFLEMEKVVMEDREEQEKLCQEEARARAATKLQAWWRGCMVRRGLGSFKKAEKGKKGTKKEGKKKKKK
ncbi:dynein regulatory complex protein 9-like [Archocentrus centrarchus]|uniref:dynein regulatory complex protein 9-like n=1 Tax=Archocentrus centrarchus TaxID=63155 RepID=UPI0011E9D8F9|nr:dynein regulatory complex protein 9-like [Archocentrus centrarchus]XP_030606647.1 dynein regulatory complex protein 9-like [Archocentrus centrarchus]